MSQAIDQLIRRLVNMFGDPKCEDPKQYLSDVRRSLKGYSDDLIELAGDKAIDECTFFPRPAELRQFISTEIAIRNIGKPKNALPQQPELPPPTPEQVERARKLVAEFLSAHQVDLDEQVQELERVQKPAFERMQRESTSGLQRLTERSRQMMGERDE